MTLASLLPEWFLDALAGSDEGQGYLYVDDYAALLIWLPEGNDLDRAGQALSHALCPR